MSKKSMALLAAIAGLGMMHLPNGLVGRLGHDPDWDEDEPEKPKEKTEADYERLRKAQEKRDRKAAKRRKNEQRSET